MHKFVVRFSFVLLLFATGIFTSSAQTGSIKGRVFNSINNEEIAFANVGIEGIAPADLAKTLLTKYKVWTVAINSANVKGVRITPQLFTTTAELDVFVKALKEIAAV